MFKLAENQFFENLKNLRIFGGLAPVSEKKYISEIYKDLVYSVEKTSLTKEVTFFINCRFFFLHFLMKIIQQKQSLYVRLCQLLFNLIQINMIFENCRSQTFCKLSVLNSFAIISLESLFNKVIGLRPVTILKVDSSAVSAFLQLKI